MKVSEYRSIGVQSIGDTDTKIHAVTADTSIPIGTSSCGGLPIRSYLHVVVIDQVDDFQVPGQEFAQHVDRPPLQGLGQNGVIGVSARLLGQLPCLQSKHKPCLVLFYKLSIFKIADEKI